MKAVCILGLATLLLTASALPVEQRIPGENGWNVPSVDGSTEWINRAEAEKLLSNAKIINERLANDVSFYLYTKSNPINGQRIEATDLSIKSSNFNKNHETRIVIHGWTQSYLDSINTDITRAWLSRGDYNIIVVDWARARSTEYASSFLAVPGAGAKVGIMIKYLHSRHGMSLDTLFVIGHSLGAHVSGFAGKTVGDGRIHAIIALDAGLPLFSYDTPSTRLSETDAFYVESIQTNGGQLGFLKPIGRGSFYPNGGKVQPGCGVDTYGICSHGRSVTYYVEAVTLDNFASIKCQSYEDAVNKNCASTYSSVRLGADYNAYMVRGYFYVPVNSMPPFGKITQ